MKTGHNFIKFYKGVSDDGVGSSDRTALWKMIWGLAVPPKVRDFLWRLCRGALPTVEGLHRRIESISPMCIDVGGGKNLAFMLFGHARMWVVCGN